MSPNKRLLIAAGLAIALAGLAWAMLVKSGRADLLWSRGGVTIFAPVVTCILLSMFVSLLVWLARRQ